MKKIFFSILGISAIFFVACSSGGDKNNQEGQDNNKDTAQHSTLSDYKDVKVVPVTYTNVDGKAAVSINNIVDHYLQIKNALANDNGTEAAAGAKAMNDVVRKLDKSLLTSEQKKIYDAIEADLKEHADHIGKNGNNIKHQRSYFSMMSQDIYDLAKAFGGGRALYHDHCPMYDENKGAMWLSESIEIKNPYYGAEMLTCGRVEEIIK